MARPKSYWVGPGDRMVLGYSRAWSAAAACAVMLAIGGTQYAFGVFAVRLGIAHHWGPLAAGLGFAAWLACHAAASGALPACRRRVSVAPAKVVTVGAACCALGLLLVGRIADPAVALAVYALTAGTGAGLVSATCLAVTADWFPDKHVPAALASGAFGFGAIPVIAAVAAAKNPAVPLSVLAWVIVTVTALCAPLLRDAPRRWWPPEFDPKSRAVHPTVNVWAVTLLDITVIPLCALAYGWNPRESALALAVFAAASGGVRALAVRPAGRIGRRLVAASPSTTLRKSGGTDDQGA